VNTDAISFDDVTSIEALFDAHRRALKGKRGNDAATAFDSQLASRLLVLQRELRTDTYQPLPYRRKVIHEPKRREIEAPAYRDRIVQHALHVALAPLFERHFIGDSHACRPGRGIHSAADRVQHFLRASGKDVYVCQLDISKYYASVNHERLMELLARKVEDERVLDLLRIIVESTDSGTEHDHLFAHDSPYLTGGRRGIPIGNLTSQLFANVYLHEADAYAKRKLKIRHYVRYMDDILFFHEDKAQLRAWRLAMTAFLERDLKLTVNPRKVRIYPARTGVGFVGFTIFRTHRRLRGSSVRRFTKRYKRQLVRLASERIEPSVVLQTLSAWQAHAAHASSKTLDTRMRGLYADHMFVRAIRRAHRRRTKANPGSQLSFFDFDM